MVGTAEDCSMGNGEVDVDGMGCSVECSEGSRRSVLH